MARYEDLPYRTCVGMMLINAAGLVFIGRRAGGIEHVDETHVWQMPQGGVDPGEDTWEAAKRELYEETSVRSISAEVGTASMVKSALAKGIDWAAVRDGAALRGEEPSSR